MPERSSDNEDMSKSRYHKKKDSQLQPGKVNSPVQGSSPTGMGPQVPEDLRAPLSQFQMNDLEKLEKLHPGSLSRLIELTELQTRQVLKNHDQFTQARISALQKQSRFERFQILGIWGVSILNIVTGIGLLFRGSGPAIVWPAVMILIASMVFLGCQRNRNIPGE